MNMNELAFLVAEDHDFQRRTLVRILQNMGVKTVYEAADGRSALEIFRDPGRQVDIIISDLDMPEMDGMEFIRHVGEAGVQASLILSSALERTLIASVETMTRAYGINLLGAVDKPVTAKKLASLVGAYRPAGVRTKRAPMEQMPLAEIDEGIAAGQFEPFLQPKVGMDNAKVTGAEALVRWRHPERGLIPPAAFIPALEENDRIDELTWVVLDRTAQTVRKWQDSGRINGHTVSVNLSLKTLNDPKVADHITECVRRHGVAANRIVLEITETAAMTDVAHCLENLSRLRMKGFGLSIDDFGTGYSSMQQLARVPYTELKIDQSFVMGAASEARLRVMLESSMQLADKLGLTVVAEGVETHDDWKLLQQLGCHKAQGYFIARPMPAEEFLDWAEQWAPPR
ncbi:MAG TPA: EAL domain-containing response regulator [Burkholderiales bacterium]|nr:EAL domain-containing response regulator [Burkholderiales bacterium]